MSKHKVRESTSICSQNDSANPDTRWIKRNTRFDELLKYTTASDIEQPEVAACQMAIYDWIRQKILDGTWTPPIDDVPLQLHQQIYSTFEKAFSDVLHPIIEGIAKSHLSREITWIDLLVQISSVSHIPSLPTDEDTKMMMMKMWSDASAYFPYSCATCLRSQGITRLVDRQEMEKISFLFLPGSLQIPLHEVKVKKDVYDSCELGDLSTPFHVQEFGEGYRLRADIQSLGVIKLATLHIFKKVVFGWVEWFQDKHAAFKKTIADFDYVVLGSGDMSRLLPALDLVSIAPIVCPELTNVQWCKPRVSTNKRKRKR